MNKSVPRNLSAESKSIWRKILGDYEITDSAGLAILQVALEAFDRMRAAQAIIKKEGMTLMDRFSQVKGHPLCSIERDARSQFLLALKHLNLDLEGLNNTPGRPPGS